MKRLASLITFAFAMTIAGAGVVAAASDTNYDYKVPHSAAANQASFWVNHFENKGYTNVSCTKYGESHSGWLPGQYEAGIIKAGQWNYVWLQPDNVGRFLQAPQDLSHIFKCNFDDPPEILDPYLKIRVCGDPRLLMTINNTRSTVPVTYRFTFRHGRTNEAKTFSVTVKAGDRDVLFPRWVWGNSTLGYTIQAPGFFTTAMTNQVRLPDAKPWSRSTCPVNYKAAKRQARLH